ncbi:alpha/beta hydrolase [Crocosphaera sp.]|uniref:alpha/beta hydrolase n=1 Tax=Crocosphaera sp. TaxID=2729996 RepID=UPI003F1E9979|nr:alpha/beta fold hydrolase [Crocosphaera sp.]
MMINLLLKGLLNGVGVGMIAYLSICAALILGQNRLIFKPSSAIQTLPSDLGMSYEDVWLSVMTPQGKIEQVHGWWINPNSYPDKVLLYLHGIGGNISYNLSTVQTFYEQGYSVFIIDYRGYGRSQGQFPTESEIYRDSQVAWDYLTEERQIKPQNIFIYGHSLGGAVAIDLGVRKPHAAGVIAENTFTSMIDMTDHSGFFYKLFPSQLLVHQRFDSLAKLSLLKVPLLLIHGTSDLTVPYTMSETLFQTAKVPKKLLLVEDAGHMNISAIAPEKYIKTLNKFEQLVNETQRELALEY